MGAVVVMVNEAVGDQASEVVLVEGDDVVGKIATVGKNETFGGGKRCTGHPRSRVMVRPDGVWAVDIPVRSGKGKASGRRSKMARTPVERERRSR